MMRLHAERTIPGRVVRIATYGALAIGLYTVENLLPSPIPWLRIGASNVAVVLALYELGVVPAAGVLLLKLVLGSLLFGRFLSPFFWFGLAGGTLGLAAMAVAVTAGRRWLSVVGVSIAGGVSITSVSLRLRACCSCPRTRLRTCCRYWSWWALSAAE